MAVAGSSSNPDSVKSYYKDTNTSNSETIKECDKEDPILKKEIFGQLHTIQQIKSRKIHRKRRHSTTEDVPSSTQNNTGKSFLGKHRRSNAGHFKKGYVGDIILPTKFLLGGNISDPLNLNSMLDENVNKAVNAVTPSSSPLPPRSSKINIVIPSDMTDPLGLNLSQDESEKINNSCAEDTNVGEKSLDTLEPKANHKKKKRRRKSQHEKASVPKDSTVQTKSPLDNANLLNSLNQRENIKLTQKITKTKKLNSRVLEIEPDVHSVSTEKHHANLTIAVPQLSSVVVDPIVSPVIPQDVKRNSTNHPTKSKKRKSTSNPPAKTNISSTESSKTAADGANHNSGLLTTHKENNMNDRLVCEIKTARLLSNTVKSNETKKRLTTHPEQHNNSSKKHPQKKFKPLNARFQYGNYSQYYGYRNPCKFHDIRMDHFKREWFKEKDILDVGCNAGHLTLLIARDFSPRKVVGVDIDEGLINIARKNIRHYSTAETRPTSSKPSKYPDSMSVMFGPIIGPPLETAQDELAKFPNNIVFLQGNYVPEKDEVLQCQEPEYDVIMCMSVTKWVHLNWGDDGLKKTFQRFYKQLRPGGKLILEPQEWKSYGKKKKLTETIYTNYNSIKLKPDMFPQYLTDEVGFEKVEYIKLPESKAKGFQRPIHLYYKPE